MLNPLDGPYYRERSVAERLDKIKVPTYVGGPLFSFFSQPQINVFNRVERAQEDVPLHRHGHPSLEGASRRAAALVRLLAQGHRDRDHGRSPRPLPHHGGREVATAQAVAAGEHPVDRLLLQQPRRAFARARLLQRRARRVRAAATLRDRGAGAGQLRELAAVRTTCRSPGRRGSPSTPRSTSPTPSSGSTCARRTPTPSIRWPRVGSRRLTGRSTTPGPRPGRSPTTTPKRCRWSPARSTSTRCNSGPCRTCSGPGKQIKVEISSIDIPTDIETYDVMWHVCNSATTLHKIYRDGCHQSRASLPVIPSST